MLESATVYKIQNWGIMSIIMKTATAFDLQLWCVKCLYEVVFDVKCHSEVVCDVKP